MRDFYSRRVAKGHAVKARNSVARARKAKATGGSSTLVQMYVQWARTSWHLYLEWRRIYRAEERGDAAEVARLLAL